MWGQRLSTPRFAEDPVGATGRYCGWDRDGDRTVIIEERGKV